MRKLLVTLAVLAGSPAGAATLQDQLDGISRELFAGWPADGPGCAVAAARPGAPAATYTIGKADLAAGTAIGADTRFEVGSVSKQFVAAAILLLVADGKLSLDDDIRHFLPEVPDFGTTISVDHLLNHTSGLLDWGFAMEIAGWPRTTRAYTNDDVLAFVSRTRHLNHAPGADYSYTNTGYVLLAMIAERVSGEPLAALTQRRLFAPLGLTATSWRTDFRAIEPRLAVAYIADGNRQRERRPFEDVYGDAALVTSVGDMLRWNEALFAGRLGPFVTAKMMENGRLADGRRLTYARGLNVSLTGSREITHGGAIGGYRAWLARFPAAGDLSIAVACNAGEELGVGRGGKLGNVIADRLARTPRAAAARRKVPAYQTGLFASTKTGLPLAIIAGPAVADGDKLVADATGFRLGGSHLRFSRGGIASAHDDGTNETYTPVSPADTAPPTAAIGRFESQELGVAYDFELTGGRPRIRLVERPTFFFDLDPAYRDAWTFDTRLGKKRGIVRLLRDAQGSVTAITIGWNERVRAMRFERQPR